MSSIPLAALDLKQQPQPEGPLDQYAKLTQLKSLMQGQQLQQQQLVGAQQENQERAYALQDMQTIQKIAPNYITRDENGKPTGYDYDGLQQGAIAAGVRPQSLTQLQTLRKNAADTALAQENATGKHIENQTAINKYGFESLENIRGITDPQKRQATYQQAIAGAAGMGVDTSKFPQQAPDDNGLSQMEAGLAMHAQSLADAKDLAATKESQAKTEESNATTEKTQLEMQQLKNLGGTNPDMIELSSWLKQNPGKTPADYMKYKATLVPQFNFNLQNNTGAGKSSAEVANQFGMTPEAFDQQAEKYYSSGVLPPIGRGGAGMALNKALMNRSAELHPNATLAANSAEYKANEASLKSLQTNFDQVTAFENTAGKNLDQFLTTAKNVVDSGSPLVNTPLRLVSDQLAGSQNQVAFNAARTTALTEISKVLNSSNASGVLSDSARSEVSQLVGKNATLGQIYKAAGILKQDMANRHQSYQDQIADIQGRLGGKPSNSSSSNASTYQVGQQVKIKGQTKTITKVYSDGTFDTN